MFNHLAAIFSHIGVSIGGMFMVLGSFLGANLHEAPPSPIATSSQQITQSETTKKTSQGSDSSGSASLSADKKGNSVSYKPSTDLETTRQNVAGIYSNQIAKLNSDISMMKVQISLTESKIADINDTISSSEGYRAGDTSITKFAVSIENVYKSQLKFEQNRLAYQNRLLSWLESSRAYLSTSAVEIKSSDSAALSAKIDDINGLLDALNDADQNMALWSNESRRLQAKIDGFIAGLSSSASVPPAPVPAVLPASVPTYVPTSVHCTSKANFMGQIETTCY